MEWPNEIIDAVARRRCVIVIGSGVSANSLSHDGFKRPPTWKAFLETAAKRCGGSTSSITSSIKSGDYLTACEIIEHRMEERWRPFLREMFVDPQFKAVEIHDHIFDLDCRIVITPNFDKIYDSHALHKSRNTISVKSYRDEDALDIAKGTGRYIFKIHGDIDNPHHLIFTRQQYAHSRVAFAGSYRLVESLLLTNSFLFVGCGLNDPDFNLLLEQYRFSNMHSSPHYITLPKKVDPDIKRVLKSSKNLKVLEYDKKDNHSDLRKSLLELGALVSGRRAEIARSQDW